jgi:hypothetical protein
MNDLLMPRVAVCDCDASRSSIECCHTYLCLKHVVDALLILACIVCSFSRTISSTVETSNQHITETHEGERGRVLPCTRTPILKA